MSPVLSKNMAISPFVAAINQIADEKGLSKEIVLETVEAALAAAYRKEYGKPNQIIKAKINPETSQVKVWQVFNIVKTEKEVTEPENEVFLKVAKKTNPKAKAGETIEKELEYKEEFGRIAAQTAKQVIIQRIREAERDVLYKEFKDKEGKLLNGVVQQIEGPNVIISLGKINGIMLSSDQIKGERYYNGQRLRVYVTAVEESMRGPRILVSRSSPEFVKELFTNEVPEIAAGTVEVKGIAREAGSRTKIAVFSKEEAIDPVGSAVGQRGTRVQAVLSELGEEKIDIILYDEDSKKFITNALSPAKIAEIKLKKTEKKAQVKVEPGQLSLAIGKGGQNVRLASKLCGFDIDILKEKDKEEIEEIEDAPHERS